MVTTAVYSSLGLMLSSQTGTLAAATTLYDGVGRPRKATNLDGSYTVTTYDIAGRVTRSELFGSDNVSSEFTVLVTDGNGNVTRSTNARGAATVYVFDVLNRLESVTTPVDTVVGNNVVYTYAYDQASNLTRVTDGNGRITRYTFNVWNLPEGTLEPAAAGDTEATRLWRVSYNAGGQAATETHPGAKTVTRTFNALGLPESETAAQPTTATVAKLWGYDTDGRVVRLSHPTAPMVLTYDDRGLLVSTSGGSSPSSTVYDAAGRPVTQTDTSGTRSMTYNPATGLLNQFAEGAGGSAGVSVSDNFDRANSTDLGSAWSERSLYTGSVITDFSIAANQVTVTPGWSAAVHTTPAAGDTQYAQMTVHNVANTEYVGPAVRMAANGTQGYVVVARAGTNEVRLYRIASGLDFLGFAVVAVLTGGQDVAVGGVGFSVDHQSRRGHRPHPHRRHLPGSQQPQRRPGLQWG